MSEVSKSGGCGFLGFLTLLFIGLKLAGYIDWSWIWILCPLWIPFSIGIIFLFCMFLVFLKGKI